MNVFLGMPPKGVENWIKLNYNNGGVIVYIRDGKLYCDVDKITYDDGQGEGEETEGNA